MTRDRSERRWRRYCDVGLGGTFGVMALTYDRFLRFEELHAQLDALASSEPELVSVETYGKSFEGRSLLLVTITDITTGPAAHKPAYWVDANIHAVEVTGGAAALCLIDTLVSRFRAGDPTVVEALRTRTFYVVPRVNPDGVEAALAESPRFRRSGMRPWPWRDRHQWPGLVEQDIDGDGRMLSMRIEDPNGAWTPHADDPRVMIPVAPDGSVAIGTKRYRMLNEGLIEGYDGFTVPLVPSPQVLDMNRNFPAGWGTGVHGSGDHPLSESEVDALVRAVVARPNICGYNAFHTAGGVLLRPSSTRADSSLSPYDVWTWNELGRRGTELTTYPVHSVYEDFTWDKSSPMSGAADDWAYEHLGLFGWTTEFWDVVHAATGHRSSTSIWYLGPTVEEEVAIAAWCDRYGDLYVNWHWFDHPQLGPVEIGGLDWFHAAVNPPLALLADEVRPHADFAIYQALASPRLEILAARATLVGEALWRVEVGIANTGWLPTTISQHASKENLVLPVTAELVLPGDAEVLDGANRRQLGQLAGRVGFQFKGGFRNDGSPDRVLATWLVRSATPPVEVTASHQRAGTVRATISETLASAPPAPPR